MDLIERQAAIDTLDKHLRTTDVPVSFPGIISALTEWLNELPSAQPETHDKRTKTHSCDCISRQAAIDAILGITPMRNTIPLDSAIFNIKKLPSAQPELIEREAYIRGFEQGKTQGRLDTLSAQPEIIRCNECKYAHITYGGEVKYCDIWFPDESHYMDTDNYCSFAERRTDDKT